MKNEIIRQNSEPVLLKPNALQVHENELFNTVNAAIAKCYADLNYVVPADPEYVVNEVAKSIMERFPSLRLQEIPVAFAKGIRNEYGEYFGLSVVTFEQFIAGYLASPERRKHIEERDRVAIEQKTEPTADEKFTIAKNLTLEAFAQVSKGRSPGLTAVTVYTFLNSIGLVPKDYKKGVYRPALDELLQDKEKEIAFCLDPMKRRMLNTRIEEFRQNIEKDLITPEQHEEVLRTGKRMILISLMRDWVLDEVNVSELIEGKREDYKNSRV